MKWAGVPIGSINHRYIPCLHLIVRTLSIFFFLVGIFINNLTAAEDGIHTINYQGYLESTETNAPFNGTLEIEFIIHEPDIFPPYDDTNSLWREFHSQVNVKDGIFIARLGSARGNELTKDHFRADRPVQLTLKIVLPGTGAPSYLGPMSIDGNAYSVSSVSKSGSNEKEGTLRIIPERKDDLRSFALLEVLTPNFEEFHNVKIQWDPFPNALITANTGAGLVIQYPPGMSTLSYTFANLEQKAPWSDEPIISFNEEVQDISVYIENGTVLLGKNLVLDSLQFDTLNLPGELRAHNINILGDIRVNDLVATGPEDGSGGVIKAHQLHHCTPREDKSGCEKDNFEDYGIDPYPADGSTPTKVNRLRIQSILDASGRLLDEEKDRGELLIEGPLQSSQPAYLQVSGSGGNVYAPTLRSPYPVQRGPSTIKPYALSPAGISVLDSLVLITDTSENRDPDFRSYNEIAREKDALRSPLNAFSAFDLVSTVPICSGIPTIAPYSKKCKDTWCMALRPDYCSVDPDPKVRDKYKDIDPCEGISITQLKGYRLNCRPEDIQSDHPNLQTDPNDPAKGNKFFVTSHIHQLLNNATAKTLIEIINAVQTGQTLHKRLLPTDTVNLNLANTLTGVNIFENVHTAHQIVGSLEEEIDAYLGSFIVGLNQPARMGSLKPHITQVEFIRDVLPLGTLNLHAGSTFLHTSSDTSRPQRHLVKKDVDIGNDLVVHSSFFETHGDLHFEDVDFDPNNGPYMKHIGKVEVDGDLIFQANEGASNRNLLGLEEIVASRYIDLDDAQFSVDPNKASTLFSLKVTGPFHVFKPSVVQGSIFVDNDVYLEDSLRSENFIRAVTISDIDDPDFYISPAGISKIKGLVIEENLKIQGDFTVDSTLRVTGIVDVEGDLYGGASLEVKNPSATVRAPYLQDTTDQTLILDPTETSRLKSLKIISPTGKDGDLSIDGDLTLTKFLFHAGDAKIKGNINSTGRLLTPKLIDTGLSSYLVDPGSISRIHSLNMDDSLKASSSTSFSSSLTVEGELYSNAALKILSDLQIGEDFTGVSSLQIHHSTGIGFSIDQFGNVTGRSITLDENAFAQDLEIGGSLNLSGTPIEFNADTSMDRMSISTHALISLRSSPTLGFESAASVDKNGNMQLHNDLFVQKELLFGEVVKFHQEQDVDEILMSVVNSSITSVEIGNGGTKNLVISGLSANTLSAPAAFFKRFTDRDNSSFYLDPSSKSQFQELQIQDSLQSENTITAPYLLDLENSYIADPSSHSRFRSLEIMEPATAQQIHTAYLEIDSQNLSNGSTLLQAESLRILKGTTLFLSGEMIIRGAKWKLSHESGLLVADDRSQGNGSFLTQGDLEYLVSGKNADHLHRHDLLGGIEIYNIARQDIDNQSGTSPTTTSITKAFFGKNLFTKTGIAVSIQPDTHQTHTPIMAVRSSTSDVFQVFGNGVVTANSFQGDGSGLSNISGSGTINDSITDGSIGTIKLKDESIQGSSFSTGALELSHFKDRALDGKHFLERGLGNTALQDGAIRSSKLADQSIENIHIAEQTLTSNELEDLSIRSYHLQTRTITEDQVSLNTLESHAIGSAIIFGSLISDGSIYGEDVSTGAIDTTRISSNELQGSLFEDDSVSTSKIQTRSILTSSFQSLSLTYSDFATDSIIGTRILSASIEGGSFAANTLQSSALSPDSIDWTKIQSLSLLAEDIKTYAIESSIERTQHKVNLRAVDSNKILDREIFGEHFLVNIINLSHIALDAVSSTHIQSASILGEDILTKTLSGEKIIDFSISGDQIDNEAITSSEIQSNALDSGSIANLTLSSESFQDGSIIRSKLLSNIITSALIRDGSILDSDFESNALIQEKWAAGTIPTIKIATDAVTLQKLATGAVRSEEVQNRAILTSAIAPSAILSTHIQSAQITQSKIKDLTILVGDIAEGEINSRIVAPLSILSTNIIDLSITNSHISSSSLSSDILSDNSILRTKIKSDQISDSQIKDRSLESSNFSSQSILNRHIDVDTLSGRTLGSVQVLTTHIADLAVGNSRIQTDQIDSRIIKDASILSRVILTHTLDSSKFSLAILTDEHFQENAVTTAKISSESILESLFVSYTLEGIHVVPSTLTSNSLKDLLITSSQVKNQTISGEHIEDFSLTDLEIATDALSNSVFQIDAISSPNILDESILSQDIATGAILSTHIADGSLFDEHFADSSILTTHIANFQIGSDVLGSASVSLSKITTRSQVSEGFHSIADTSAITDSSSLLYTSNGEFLFFTPSGGVFKFSSITSPLPKAADPLALSVDQSIEKDGRIWLRSSQNLYGSFYESRSLELLFSASSQIQDLELKDLNHGAFLTDSKTYLSYDGGENFRLVREGSGFRRISFLEDFQDLWVLSEDGSLAYTTNSFESITSLVIPTSATPLPSNALFRMISSSTGFLAANGRIYKTSDNWASSTSSSSVGTFSHAFIDEAGRSVLLEDDGTVHYIDSNLNLSTKSFTPFSSPSIEVSNASFLTTSTFTFIYKRSSQDDLELALTNNGGTSYSLASLGSADPDERSQISFSEDSSGNLYFSRGLDAYKSSDDGQTWSSIPLTPPLSHISSLYFPTSSTGFGAFEDAGTYYVYKTTNSGATWTKTSFSRPNNPLIIHMEDENRGYAVEKGGTLLWWTFDGFDSTSLRMNAGSSFQDTDVSREYFHAIAENGEFDNHSAIATTIATIGGAAWKAIAADRNDGFFLANSSSVYHYTTPGASPTDWNYPSISSSIKDLCSIDSDTVLAAAKGSDTYLTRDGGSSWQRVLPEEFFSQSYTACHFQDRHHLLLGTPDQGIVVSILGEGIQGNRIANGAIDTSQLTTGFESTHFLEKSIDGSKLAAGSIDNSKFHTRSILSENLTNDLFSSEHIQDKAIQTRIFQDQAVTLAKITWESIDGRSKIAQDVLTSGDFSDLSIDYALIESHSLSAAVFTETPAYQLKDEDFVASAINTLHLQKRSFSGSQLRAGAIDSDEIANSSIQGSHFQSATITPQFLGTNILSPERMLPYSISSGSVQDGSITSNQLVSSSPWNSRLQTGSIASASLVSESFDETSFSDRSILTGLIQDSSISYRDLATQSLYGSQFQANSVSGNDFLLKTITQAKIKDGSLDASNIASGAVKGEFVIPGEILSSKIPSQAISGTLLETYTVTAQRLQELGFDGDDFQLNTLTQSKVQTRTLTDGHFSGLDEGAFSQGAFGTSGIRLYQNDSSNLYVFSRTDGKRSVAAHNLGTSPSYPRLSQDGSRVVFTKNGNIHHGDWNFANVVDTGLSYPGTPQAYFLWKADNSGFFYFDESDDKIYFYDLHLRSASTDTALPASASGGNRLVFSLDRSRWAMESGGTISASDGNCDVSNTDMENLGITADGSRIFGTDSVDNDFKFCDWGGAGFISKDFGGNARYPQVDPTDSSSVYFFIGTTLISVEFSNFSTHTEVLNTDLSTDENLLHSYFYPSHVLDDRALNGSKILAESIETSHISSLGMAADAFDSSVIYGSHLQTDSITAAHVRLTTLSESVVGSAEISSGHLEKLTLTGDHFLERSIAADRILTLSISGDRLIELAILEKHFNPGSVIYSKLSSASILTTHIADSAVTTDTQISDGNVLREHLITSEFISEDVLNGSIQTAHINNSSIHPKHIESAAIYQEHLDSEIFTNAHFEDSVILNQHLKEDAIDVGDGFFFTIESGAIYRYDHQGTNRTLVNDSLTWSKLQRTALGNSITALDGTTGWEIDPFTGTPDHQLDLPGDTWHIRKPSSNETHIIGGNSWTNGPPMPFASEGIGAAVLDDQIYIIYQDLIYALNSQTNTWVSKTKGTNIRDKGIAALNGRIYAVGGQASGTIFSTVEAYDPITDSWSVLPSLSTARQDLVAESLDGKIYAIGGRDSNSDARAIVEVYDPAIKTWSSAASMNTSRYLHSAAVFGGKIYVFGGNNSSLVRTNSIEKYDPVTNSWTTLSTTLPFGIHTHASITRDDEILIIGGDANDGSNTSSYVWSFDPQTDSIDQTRADLSEDRLNIEEAGVTYNDRVYIFGGTSPSSNSVAIYSPGTTNQISISSDSIPGSAFDDDVKASSGLDYHHDSNQVVYVTFVAGDPDQWNIIEYNGTTTSSLYNSSNPLSHPRYSPDGNNVYFVEDISGSAALKKIESDLSVSTIYSIANNSIDDLQTSMENDRVFMVLDDDIWVTQGGSTTKFIDSTSAISEFEVLPYSLFDEGEIDTSISAEAITTAIWASRVLTTGNFSSGAIQSEDLELGSFDSFRLEASSITEAKFRDSSILSSSVIAADAVTSGSIVNSSILTAHIEDSTIQSRSFASTSLTSQRLSGTISAVKLQSLTITGLRFKENTISGAKIQTGSIHHDLLTSFELSSREVLDGTISSSDLSTASFLGSLFQNRAVTGGHIQASQITSSIIKSLDLSGSLIASEALTYTKIPTGTITTALIPDQGIPGTFFENRSLTNSALGSRIITAGLISSNSVTGANLTNTLTTSSLALSTLTAEDFISASFPRDVFAGNSIDDSRISSGSLTGALINSAAITTSLIASSSIPGDSFKASAILTRHLALDSFNSSHFQTVFTSSHIDSFSLTASNFSSSAGQRLTQDDFSSTFVDTQNVADSSITSTELEASTIVKSSSDGLRLTASQIQLVHFQTESLTGRVLETDSISNLNFSDSSLSISKIKDGALLGTNIDSLTLSGSSLAAQAILSTHIPDGEITVASLALATFDQSHVSQITGDEIIDLEGSNLKSLTLTRGEISGGISNREISTIQDVNLKNLDFPTSSFSTHSVTRGHFLTVAEILISKFSGSTIPASRIQFDSLGFTKLDTDQAQISDLFFENNADSRHTHEILTQELVCPTGSAKINGGGASDFRGSSFCMDSVTGTLSAIRNQAETYTIDSKIVRARICTLEQLWKAKKDGQAITTGTLSSNFLLSPQGFGGSLKVLRFGNLSATGTGSVEEENVDDTVSHEAQICF